MDVALNYHNYINDSNFYYALHLLSTYYMPGTVIKMTAEPGFVGPANNFISQRRKQEEWREVTLAHVVSGSTGINSQIVWLQRPPSKS